MTFLQKMDPRSSAMGSRSVQTLLLPQTDKRDSIGTGSGSRDGKQLLGTKTLAGSVISIIS